MKFRGMVFVLGLSAAVLGIAVVAVIADAVRAGWPPLTLNGGISPKNLPRERMAPVTLQVKGVIAAEGQAQASDLSEMTIDLDRNISINAVGFPRCGRSQVEARDLSQCHRAIVGSGVARIVNNSVDAHPRQVPLTVFNGGVSGGDATTLFIQPSVAGAAPKAAVARVTLKGIHRGLYGTEAVVHIPPLFQGYSLRSFGITLKRHPVDAARGIVTARCGDGHLSAALVSYAFDNGETFTGETVSRTCVPQS